MVQQTTREIPQGVTAQGWCQPEGGGGLVLGELPRPCARNIICCPVFPGQRERDASGPKIRDASSGSVSAAAHTAGVACFSFMHIREAELAF